MDIASSSMSSIFGIPSVDEIKGNLSSIEFNGKDFLRILTTKNFPEKDAKKWINDHFYLTLQV